MKRKRRRNRVVSEYLKYNKQNQLLWFLKYLNLESISIPELEKHIKEAFEEMDSAILICEEKNERRILKRYLNGLKNEYLDYYNSLIHPFDKFDVGTEETHKFEEYAEFFEVIDVSILKAVYERKEMLFSVTPQDNYEKYSRRNGRGFEVKIKDIDKTALTKMRTKLVNEGFIEDVNIKLFRKCFNGDFIEEQLVLVDGMEINRLNYFIKELTEADNNYVEQNKECNRKWVTAVNIFLNNYRAKLCQSNLRKNEIDIKASTLRDRKNIDASLYFLKIK